MATHAIMNILTWILTSPFVLMSLLIEAVGLWGLNSDLSRCLAIIDDTTYIPDGFISALIAAEDHRNAIHPGVDPIAMLRSLAVRVTRNRIEGASTIEQQLVRVATGRYERTLRRKLREQMLALAIVRYRTKREIAAAYLEIAHYGTAHNGLNVLAHSRATSIDFDNHDFVISAVARLKYPEPLRPTEAWREKVSQRVLYIENRLSRLNNDKFKQALTAP